MHAGITDLITKGGFPPLYLILVDFEGVYLTRENNKVAERSVN